MRWPISVKLSLTYLGVLCVAAAPAFIALDHQLTKNLRERRDRELLTRARLIAELLAASDAGRAVAPGDTAMVPAAAVEILDPVAVRLAAIAGARITIIAPDGRVIGDSSVDSPDVLDLDPHGTRPEVREALTRGQGLRSRYSRTLGVSMRYVAVPFETPSGAAVVRLAVDQSEVEAFIQASRRLVVLAGATALVLGLLLSLVVGRAVSAPLRKMTRTARLLASGATGERLREQANDEIGDLARALNRLRADLAETLGRLESETEQLGSVLEGMTEGVLVVHPDGRIVLANRAAIDALPHGDMAIGRTPLEVTRSAELEALVKAARESGRAERGQVNFDGGERVMDASVIPLAEREGGLVVVLHDITELKRLEAVRREFVANISHELRTPLTAIRGSLDTLNEDPGLSEADRQRFLAAASRHARRLSILVEDLLALAKLDSPELQLDLVPCDLGIEVEQALALYEAQARGRGLILHAELEPDLPPVLADRAALQQILSNLIDNAIKYNRADGRVTLRGRRVGDLARVSVEDTGVGIAAVHLPRIFERLYRVDPGRSRAEGGTGLGLAIVKHLVMKHGGDVWVTSEPGQGSTFWFTVRLDLGSPPEAGM
jgi:two-component system phosphate regulon sensor histidine kinase PhoR